tara:strand:+ start:422 stop:715 length:294 start_codon:yes stop_codon:yes gene_type:complete
MIELFVEFLIDDQKHQDRVMFCTWGDQLEAVVPNGDKDCEPFSFETLQECEESAVWYGVIATANSFKKNPFHYLGPKGNRKTLIGPVVPYCVSVAVA